ncbi:MAG: hypothetical protein I4O48_07885, partial [Ralstonia sp.]|nr:hypothetical protein [Ralstonia sp.]
MVAVSSFLTHAFLLLPVSAAAAVAGLNPTVEAIVGPGARFHAFHLRA